MTQAKVIIGSGFGDEGKGLFTDYLASKTTDNACVVRFNGGAQAGHSVQMPDGRRHVFSHFGSGTLAGLPTYLPFFFVCSPIVFVKEYKELRKLECQPRLKVDPACPLTTPYDMMINQIVEQARGDKRHGSVGVGFGETLERQSRDGFSLTVSDLFSPRHLRSKLIAIRDGWVRNRLAALGVKDIPEKWARHLSDEGIIDHYIQDCQLFLEKISLAPVMTLARYDTLIFEGAQGLLLDQTYGWFPHVTRSNTGLSNVIMLAEQLGLTALDVYYLTRSYVTRHGAGPLPHELPEQPYEKIVDPTNRPHSYQGNLRFAWLDIDLLQRTVLRDLSARPRTIKITPHIGMSCLDQIDRDAYYIVNGNLRSCSPEALVEKARRAIGGLTTLSSYGPTRATVEPGQSRKSFLSATWRGDGFLQSFNIAQHDVLAAI